MEAYALTALHYATRTSTPPAARRWAGWTAGLALALGIVGQVAYHLLAASGRTSAPWPVTVLVSSLPVLAIGAAGMLWHLLGRDQVDEPTSSPVPDVHPDTSVQVDADAEVDAEVDARTDTSTPDVHPGPAGRPLAALDVPRLDLATLDAVRAAGEQVGRVHLSGRRPVNGTAVLERPDARTDADTADVWKRFDTAHPPWTWARLGRELGCSADAARKRAIRRASKRTS